MSDTRINRLSLVQSETKLSLLNMTSVPSLTGFLKKLEMIYVDMWYVYLEVHKILLSAQVPIGHFDFSIYLGLGMEL